MPPPFQNYTLKMHTRPLIDQRIFIMAHLLTLNFRDFCAPQIFNFLQHKLQILHICGRQHTLSQDIIHLHNSFPPPHFSNWSSNIISIQIENRSGDNTHPCLTLPLLQKAHSSVTLLSLTGWVHVQPFQETYYLASQTQFLQTTLQLVPFDTIIYLFQVREGHKHTPVVPIDVCLCH